MKFVEEKIKIFAKVAIGENKKAWEPLIRYTAIYNISAPQTVRYLKGIGIDMNLRKIQRWKKQCIEKWNLPKPQPGPPCSSTDDEYEQWYEKYGQPSMTDLLKGWKPGDAVTEEKWDLEDDDDLKNDNSDSIDTNAQPTFKNTNKSTVGHRPKLEQITKTAGEAALELEQ